MAIYNTTFLENSSNIAGVADGVNTMTNSWYAYLILIVVFLICFISMKKYDTEAVFLSSSFITLIVSIFMFIKEWISIEVLAIPIVLTLIGIFYVAATK